MAAINSPVALFEDRYKQYEREMNTYRSHWRELAEYVFPRVGRWLVSDRARHSKKNGKIYNPTATYAVRTLNSFLDTSMVSPNSRWFRLGLRNMSDVEDYETKLYLNRLEKLYYAIFSRSNFYKTVSRSHLEQIVFGPGPYLVEEDFAQVANFIPLTAGSYVMATDRKGFPTMLGRKEEFTTEQVVNLFGREGRHRAPKSVVKAYDDNNLNEPVVVYHMLEHNDDRMPEEDRPEKEFAWRGVYWADGHTKHFLRVDGYRTNPIIAPRWSFGPGDPYGESPTMDVLNLTKGLQHFEREILKQTDLQGAPPTIGPPGMQGEPISTLPGAVNFGAPGATGRPALQAIYQVSPDIAAMEVRVANLEMRIQRGLYTDLILMMQSVPDRERTAREIEEHHEEKLFVLGGVAEGQRVYHHDPLFDRLTDVVDAAGIGPEVPDSMEGSTFEVEYISALAQAQKFMATRPMDLILDYMGRVAAARGDTSVFHKMNVFGSVDEYADALGVPASLLVSDDDAEAAHQRAIQAQRNAEAMAAGQQGAETAKTMADTSVGDRTALDVLAEQMGQPV